MPLFKLIIQTINQNNKQNENIFRWSIKESIENVTYEHLIKRLQGILCRLRNNHDDYNHNDDDDDVINDDLQILWYDGEDMCRIISTEDLHDAAKTLAGPQANDCSIRIYIKATNYKLMKYNLNNEKTDIIHLPDLPSTLEKLDLDETNQSIEIINNYNEDHIKDPLKQSTMNRSISSDCQYQSNCIMPSAPTLPTSPLDVLFASLSSSQSNISSIQSYPIFQSSNLYTTYPYNTQLCNQMKLTRLSPSSSSLLPGYLPTDFTSYQHYASSTLQYYCLPQTHMNNTLSLRNNMQSSSSKNLPSKSLCNTKSHMNIAAIIIQLRHMGFQQTDMYLSSIIQQYNGNFNSILDRLSIDKNNKL
uniref:SJCHGC00710 protein n=1 Tax=Schistosoma japonicum TaxID=6182 RepID=Q5D9F3_SCHJA|nr:SJCHGC00710 protein [Schistosoma japonicum]